MTYYTRQIKPFIQPPALPGFDNEPYPVEGYDWVSEDMKERLKEEIVVKDSWSTLVFKERFISVDTSNDKLADSKDSREFWTSEQWESWTEEARQRLEEIHELECKHAILDIDLAMSQFGVKDSK